jgi:DNA modification methylase
MNWKVLFDKEITFNLPDLEVQREDEDVIEFTDGSKYHKSNNLNELTNKEWLKFQKSWFVFNPKPRKTDVLLHPAKFPEELVGEFIKFFTKSGDVVLDPMLGTGSTMIACANSGRAGIGIELQEKYAALSVKRLEEMLSQIIIQEPSKGIQLTYKIFNGDARDIPSMDLPEIDYCITSPPYWDMLTAKGFETQQRRKEEDLDVHYSDDSADLGNIHSYNEFLDQLEDIYQKVFELLKPKAYMTIIVKNIKKKNLVFPLAWDIGQRLSTFFMLKDEKIWCQDDVKLAPYGYRNAWVSNTVHHYCLNFRKE